jgi:hypothetical protein
LKALTKALYDNYDSHISLIDEIKNFKFTPKVVIQQVVTQQVVETDTIISENCCDYFADAHTININDQTAVTEFLADKVRVYRKDWRKLENGERIWILLEDDVELCDSSNGEAIVKFNNCYISDIVKVGLVMNKLELPNGKDYYGETMETWDIEFIHYKYIKELWRGADEQTLDIQLLNNINKTLVDIKNSIVESNMIKRQISLGEDW